MYKVTLRLMSSLTAFDRPYTYLSDEPVSAGTLTAIPFGNSNRNQYGIAVSCTPSDGEEKGLKRVLFTLPETYSLTPLQMGLADFMTDRFFATFGDCARLMLPTGLDIDTAEYVVKGKAFDSMEDCEVKRRLLAEDRVYLDKDMTSASLRGYVRKGQLALCTEALCHVNEKKERCARALPVAVEDRAVMLKGAKNKEKYNTVLDHLSGVDEMPVRSLYEIYSIDSAGIAFLEKRGLIETVMRSVERAAYSTDRFDTSCGEIVLSDEQKEAYDVLAQRLDSQKASAALLYGVTGSGKTSVVLSLIDKAVSDGKGVIMLVPEIALTSQSARALFSRYGDKVAMIHSGMSKGERHDSWEAIRSGRKNVVLGTRSAIFAPVKELGLVIIDEEQDDSYKSDTNPRYHARDVARYICANSNALLLLASATPDRKSVV